MASEDSKSGRRFGARYGRTNRDKFAKIEKEQRRLHTCPSCNMVKVERKAAGIWHCSKCGSTFANKAYTISKVTLQEEVQAAEIGSEQKEAV